MKPFKEVVIVLILLYFATDRVFGQSPSQIDVLTTEQGLPFREVKSIAQDANGLMWFGTSQGIIRYDGYQFKSYNSDKSNPYYIEEELITGEFVFDSTKQNLWFMANDRLFSLELATDKVVEYSVNNNIKGKVLRLLKTTDNTIWVVTDDYWLTQNGHSKQYLQKYVNGRFEVIASIPRKDRGFSQLITDAQGHIWWSTPSGTYQYNSQGNLLETYILDSYNWFGVQMHFTLSFFDSENTHYYFPHEKGGIHILNKEQQTSQRLFASQTEFFYAKEDNQHHIWFAGGQALYRMNPQGKFIDYTQQLQQHFDYSRINDLFVDANDLLWVATDNGLFKIRLGEHLFSMLFKSETAGWGNSMRGFFEDAQGTVYGLCESSNTIVYKTRSGIIDTLRLYPTRYNHSELQYAANFFALDETKEHVFTAAIDLLKINLKTGKVKSYKQFKPNLKVYGPNPLLKLRDGRLLFGYTFSRLTLFDPKTETSKTIFNEDDDFPEITDMRYFKESHQDNQVWIGTQNDGLFKISTEGTFIKTYQTGLDSGITKNYILVLEENEDGSLWVGTYGGGLNYISADGQTVKNYTTAHGLPNNTIVGILPDEKNNLWISTYNGLSYFDVKNQSFQNFYTEDGLSHNEFNYASFFKDSNGKYYFGGMNGVTFFEANKVLTKTTSPALKFLSVSGYNNKLKNSFSVDLNQTPMDVITVSPYDQYFQVNWTMPNYFKNQKNTYFTKLEGYDEKWFFQGNSASIRYNQLPPGEYTLKVKGTDSRGNASSSILAIPVQVKQIFYKKWWFIGLLIILSLALVYAFFQYRLNHALAIERLRTKISSDLHDDVGSMLTGLAMQTEMLEMQTNNTIDKTKLHQLTTISRNTISHMRDLVWSIDSRKDTLADLLERMQELAEELLLPANITYTFSTDDSNLQKKVNINCRRNIFLIYKEALTNIIKHSNAKNVKVHIANTHNGCVFRIKDDGSFTIVQNSTGMGLANMEMRANSINARLEFNTKNGFGITLHLPHSI